MNPGSLGILGCDPEFDFRPASQAPSHHAQQRDLISVVALEVKCSLDRPLLSLVTAVIMSNEDDSLAQRLGSISLAEDFGRPNSDAAALFGSRELLGPTEEIITHAGKRRQIPGNKHYEHYEKDLREIEVAVESRGHLLDQIRISD
jgi:hypothetical protein